MKIGKRFTFEAAHHLPNYDGPCARPHGHSYVLEVEVDGKPDSDTGMVMDYVVLSALVKEVIVERIDHRDLNDSISNPTAENILIWIVDELQSATWETSINVCRVRLHETATSWAEVTL